MPDGANATGIHPSSVRWDAATHTAYLDVSGLPAGHYQLIISGSLRSAAHLAIGHDTTTSFTALLNMSSQLHLTFSDTRADQATGAVSYDVSVTNVGTDDIDGPLMLLLDPGAYFGDSIAGATQGKGDRSELWILNLTDALAGIGGKLAPGATLADQTVTVIPADAVGGPGDLPGLAKFKLGQDIYAVPQTNLPPSIGLVSVPAANSGTGAPVLDYTSNTFASTATVGKAWTAKVGAMDPDGTVFHWQLVKAPAGVTLNVADGTTTDSDGHYHSTATLSWTPDADAPADSVIVLRVVDSRGGVALRTFHLPVAGGNHAPTLSPIQDIHLDEGQSLSLPVSAADADGDVLTVSVANLPPGATYDAATGLLSWTPGYDQAGVYKDVTVSVSDGDAVTRQHFNITVAQAQPAPVLASIPAQTLREGDSFGLQLTGSLPGGLSLADGSKVKLSYSAPLLPGGMTLNSDTGWLAWKPGYNQHGNYNVKVVLTATYTKSGGSTVVRHTTRTIKFDVLNANGAPVFDANVGDTWHVLEGQPLSIGVFAFDPDNPHFAPKVRLGSGGKPVQPTSDVPASVSYQVLGLPDGATFNPDTLEINWAPNDTQAGTYHVTVIATDNGDGTGTPASSRVTIPIVVGDTNHAPVIAPISDATIDKGATLDIPVSITDVDGNPVTLTIQGLPKFATYTQDPSSGDGHITGTIHFAPGARDRGDYTITLIARDNGDGNPHRVLTQSVSFVVTARSLTEPPVFTLPKQIVAVAGQPISLPVTVSDADQDALHFSTSGMPLGATLTPETQYGHAVFTWTPTTDDLGTHDIVFTVADSGLPPQDAGYTNPTHPVPNVVSHKVRIIVRKADAAPQLLGLQIDGQAVADSGDSTTPVTLTATEAVPLTLDLFADDADADLINWTATGLPKGMTLSVPGTAHGDHVQLTWTPGLFAAQDDNVEGSHPGVYRFTVTGSDGAKHFTRSFEVHVANVDQAPVIPPLPRQLVNEGHTLSFNVQSLDADGDPLNVSMVYGKDMPAGVSFDPTTGLFEWTPGPDVVNNATADNRDFTFTFQASDGTLTTTQTVDVRVFDTDRAPTLHVANHLAVVGQALTLPVHFGSDAGKGITVNDPDGATQTQALAVSFIGLPEGAHYDAKTQQLTWTPGPGQVGDYVITAEVSDGQVTTKQTFTVRVGADASADAPKVLIDSVPSTPAVPGQSILVTVRASSFTGIANVAVEVRGSGLGTDQWQSVTLDNSGRFHITPTQPGLIDVRVTATDVDGYSHTQDKQLLIADPADHAAPVLAWSGALQGASQGSRPVDITSATNLEATLDELQAMGYELQIAPVGSSQWRDLAKQSLGAAKVDKALDLARLDPADFDNGVYKLRLTAWDLSGRRSEIDARVIINSTHKTPPADSATDATYMLGGHAFVVRRVFNGHEGDFGNWSLVGLDSHLTTNQRATTASGETAPWEVGAQLWLTMPASLSTSKSPVNLHFTLGAVGTSLDASSTSPIVYHAHFADDQGWQLQAVNGEHLQRMGDRLYGELSDMPWVPSGYRLTAPDGTVYTLDARGKVTSIQFSDGVQWLVSDDGIALVGSPTTRVSIVRDSHDRIARITGPTNTAGNQRTIVYRYDAEGRLVLARPLDSNDFGTPYGYDSQGAPFTGTLTANLGTAADWLGTSTANTWTGSLTAGQTATIGFTVRASELASTVKVPGAQGALILAIHSTTSDPSATLHVVGGEVLGSTVHDGGTTTLVRVTRSGLKLLRLTGTGTAKVTITIAGDLNHNGTIDGADSAAFEQDLAGGNLAADLNGDGQVNSTDREILYANYGWRANLPPVAATNLPVTLTHTDLSTRIPLTSVAQDFEGDTVFWRILGATHGTARLSNDGKAIVFTPDAGYIGTATVTVGADDGYASSAPIKLTVHVSGAKLTAIHLQRPAHLAPGEVVPVQATVDFADEKGVDVSADPGYLHLAVADLSDLGEVGTAPVTANDARGLLTCTKAGPA